MDKKELMELCYKIAETRAAETTNDIKIYHKTIKILFEYLGKENIAPQDDGLHLSADQMRVITSSLNLRKRTNLAKGNCLMDILWQLNMKNLYKGPFPNVPLQLERKLTLNLSTLPFQSYKDFLIIRNTLLNPIARTTDIPLTESAEEYLAEFLASSYSDGALWDDFHREVMSLSSHDITFAPLTTNLPLSQRDHDEDMANKAFFRCWLSPRTEICLLRLMLLFKKHANDIGLHLDGYHVFPDEWRSGNFLDRIPKIFERWTRGVLRAETTGNSSLGIQAFRKLCIFELLPVVPPFVLSALSGLVMCDSFDRKGLGLVDNTLSKAWKLPWKEKIDRTTDKSDRSEKDETEALLEQGRTLLNANPAFLETMTSLKRIIGGLPQNASLKERRRAAAEVTSILSSLPDESSLSPDRFLLNVRFLALWLAFMLKETKFDISTILKRVVMISSKFIFMLGNNSIHQLSTDMLIDVIVKTYTFYDSEGISQDIHAFTDHLYDLQDNMYPEMQWEALPWRKDILHKEKVRRTKPFISFQMIRNVLDEISSRYPEKTAKRLRAAVLLGFYAGLRIVEVANLKPGSLILDGGYTLMIRDSKTKSSTRNLNLSLLMPGEALNEIISFFQRDNCIELTDDTCIFSDYGPDEARQFIPTEVAKILRHFGLPNARFHHLRHSFANWFVVRSMAALHGADFFPPNSSFLNEQLFEGKYLGYVNNLFFGFAMQRKAGYKSFPHIMLVLARLMGHYGPITTMSSYLHIIDWVCKLHMSKCWNGMTLDVDSTTVQTFLQVSYPTLPDSLKKKSLKGIPAADIIREQLMRLI